MTDSPQVRAPDPDAPGSPTTPRPWFFGHPEAAAVILGAVVLGVVGLSFAKTSSTFSVQLDRVRWELCPDVLPLDGLDASQVLLLAEPVGLDPPLLPVGLHRPGVGEPVVAGMRLPRWRTDEAHDVVRTILLGGQGELASAIGHPLCEVCLPGDLGRVLS